MKVGDIVKIVNPEMLIRVGYPETLESAKEKLNDWVKAKTGKDIYADIKAHYPFLLDLNGEILKEFAKQFNKNHLKFGGNDRKVYTKRVDEYENKFAKIIGRKTRQTGTREANNKPKGRRYILNYQKTHVFFELALIQGAASSAPTFLGLNDYSTIGSREKGLLIERNNLEFIMTP